MATYKTPMTFSKDIVTPPAPVRGSRSSGRRWWHYALPVAREMFDNELLEDKTAEDSWLCVRAYPTLDAARNAYRNVTKAVRREAAAVAEGSAEVVGSWSHPSWWEWQVAEHGEDGYGINVRPRPDEDENGLPDAPDDDPDDGDYAALEYEDGPED